MSEGICPKLKFNPPSANRPYNQAQESHKKCQFIAILYPFKTGSEPYISSYINSDSLIKNIRIFLELGHFDKKIIYNTKKKGMTGKIPSFSPGNSKNCTLNGKFHP